MYWLINIAFMLLFSYLFGDLAGLLSGVQTIQITAIAYVMINKK